MGKRLGGCREGHTVLEENEQRALPVAPNLLADYYGDEIEGKFDHAKLLPSHGGMKKICSLFFSLPSLKLTENKKERGFSLLKERGSSVMASWDMEIRSWLLENKRHVQEI